jgi:hypothetical protein
MKIDLRDILLYIDCPVKYLIRQKYKNPLLLQLSDDFDDAIHKTLLFYYYKIMNKQPCSIDTLKKKWGELWYECGTKEEFAFREGQGYWRDTRRRMELRGVYIIDAFFKNEKNLSSIPLIVNTQSPIQIGEDVVMVNIELVRETQDKKIEIVDFRTELLPPKLFGTSFDIALTAQAHAFHNNFDTIEDRIIYYYLGIINGQNCTIRGAKEIITTRNAEHMAKFEYIMYAAIQGIKNEIFYPRYSKACDKCLYLGKCNAIKFKKVKK